MQLIESYSNKIPKFHENTHIFDFDIITNTPPSIMCIQCFADTPQVAWRPHTHDAVCIQGLRGLKVG